MVAGVRVPLVSAGYSTVEDLPVFHCCPGGSALRAAVAPVRVSVGACGYCGLAGELAASRDALHYGFVECSDLAMLAARWSVNLVLLDGPEPLANAGAGAVECIASELGGSVALAARWHGLTREPPDSIDVVIAEYSPGWVDAEALVRLLGFLESEASLGEPRVEAVVYLEKPVVEHVRPLVERIEGSNVPLHIFVSDYYGGKAAMDLLAWARSRVRYAYLHAGPYSELDTRCPSCGAGLTVRLEYHLAALAVEGGSCPKCGTPIPLRRVVAKKTPVRVLRLTRGGTVWYRLDSLPVRVDYSY